MLIKELVKMLQEYPNQEVEIMQSDSEYGDEEPGGIEEVRHYINRSRTESRLSFVRLVPSSWSHTKYWNDPKNLEGNQDTHERR